MAFKTFFLLLVAVVVAMASSDPKPLPVCRDLPSKLNFDPEKYFSGHWYLTHMYYPGAPLDSKFMVCVKNKATIFENNIIRDVYSVYSPMDDKFLYTEGYINGAHLSKGKYLEIGRPLVESNPKSLALAEFHTASVTVIASDDKNYSIIYNCYKVGDTFYSGAFSIMSRTKNLDDIHPDVELVLRRLGLKLDQFTSIKDVECKEDSSV